MATAFGPTWPIAVLGVITTRSKLSRYRLVANTGDSGALNAPVANTTAHCPVQVGATLNVPTAFVFSAWLKVSEAFEALFVLDESLSAAAEFNVPAINKAAATKRK